MMAYGYYGGMVSGVGGLWMLLVPGLLLGLVAWGPRTAR